MIRGFKLESNYFNCSPQDGYPIGSGKAGALIYGCQRGIQFNISDSNAWVEYIEEEGQEKSLFPLNSFSEFSSAVRNKDFDMLYKTFDEQYKRIEYAGRLALLSRLTLNMVEDEIVILDFHNALDIETGIYSLSYETGVRKLELTAFFETESNLLCIKVSESLKHGDYYKIDAVLDSAHRVQTSNAWR